MDIEKRFSTQLSNHPKTIKLISRLIHHGTSVAKDVTLPKSFDGRVVWGKLLGKIRNQGSCGSCWAFATVTALSQRIAIYTRGDVLVQLSPAQSVLCDFGERELILRDRIKTEGGRSKVDTKDLDEDSMKELACHGNSILGAWQHLYRFGTTSETCIPYDLGSKFPDLGKFDSNMTIPLCEDIMSGKEFALCLDGKTPARRYRASKYYYVHGTSVNGGSEEDIRREIYVRGPVTTGMTVYSDFLEWDGVGIYTSPKLQKVEGGHAVVLIGWGEENGVKYWIVQNSWGSSWGDGGYFRLQRGSNTCDIESNVIGGLPDIPGVEIIDVPNRVSDPNDESLRNEWPLDSKSMFKEVLVAQNSSLGKPYYKRYRYDKFVAGKIIIETNKSLDIAKLVALVVIVIIIIIIRNRISNGKSRHN